MFGEKKEEQEVVFEIPDCAFCLTAGKSLQAVWFGRTIKDCPSRGADANLCQEHAEMYGHRGKLRKLVLQGMTLALAVFLWASPAMALDMNRIAHIESSGNPAAVSRAGAIGLFQVMPIVVADYNARATGFGGRKYLVRDMFSAYHNTRVASWYLNVRIPQMLRHYGLRVSDRNILIAYNAGINVLVKKKPLPTETVQYLKKYFHA